jgi:hypothetical protein
MWLSKLRDICIEVPFNEPGKNVKSRISIIHGIQMMGNTR